MGFCMEKRCDFEIFKSNMCHRLKELGDTEFIMELLEEDYIGKLYNKNWYPECLYLLAMLDYISKEQDVPLCSKYENMRKLKLKETIFPSSILAMATVSKNDAVKQRAIKESIPEFIRFNIVENDIRNVV